MSVPSPELVIFDCDGVLVDSERLTAEVSAEILATQGWAVTADEILELFTGCTDEFWRDEIEVRTGRRPDHTWDAEHGHRYERAFDERLTPVDGIVHALHLLEVPWCVASNGSHAKVRANLGRTGLLPLFEGRIFSAEDVATGKPSPDLFLHAAATMGVDPVRCVVVEDSVPGVTAARAAGMRVLAYMGGDVAEDRLAGPSTTLFHDMRDLPGLLVD